MSRSIKRKITDENYIYICTSQELYNNRKKKEEGARNCNVLDRSSIIMRVY